MLKQSFMNRTDAKLPIKQQVTKKNSERRTNMSPEKMKQLPQPCREAWESAKVGVSGNPFSNMLGCLCACPRARVRVCVCVCV